MKINTIDAYVFSPTRTTKKITEAVIGGIRPQTARIHDATKSSLRNSMPQPSGADAVILAAPVYYGRLPESIVPVFKRLKGDGKPVFLIVVYGNREFDDALVELHDISVEQGFVPAAAGAFIGEHSYSLPGRPIAPGRPDPADLDKAAAFGSRIRECLGPVLRPEALASLDLPGNRPYKTPDNLLKLKQVRQTVAFTPETDPDRCTQCGICVDVCPEAAIDACDVADIDRWKCIVCFACVKSCPEQAKNLTEPNFDAAIRQMAEMIARPKDPTVFLPKASV